MCPNSYLVLELPNPCAHYTRQLALCQCWCLVPVGLHGEISMTVTAGSGSHAAYPTWKVIFLPLRNFFISHPGTRPS